MGSFRVWRPEPVAVERRVNWDVRVAPVTPEVRALVHAIQASNFLQEVRMTPEQLRALPSYANATYGLPAQPPQKTILALIHTEPKK